MPIEFVKSVNVEYTSVEVEYLEWVGKEMDELKQQIADLVAVLTEARKAIKSLDAEALGFGGTDRYQWCLRDELLNNIDKALAQVGE